MGARTLRQSGVAADIGYQSSGGCRRDFGGCRGRSQGVCAEVAVGLSRRRCRKSSIVVVVMVVL